MVTGDKIYEGENVDLSKRDDSCHFNLHVEIFQKEINLDFYVQSKKRSPFNFTLKDMRTF